MQNYCKIFAHVKKKQYLCTRFWRKAISHQPSAISRQPSAISHQLSAAWNLNTEC